MGVPMTAQVELNRLNIAFEQSGQLLKVVEEVNFCIEPAEILALLGESGCGKSVMAQAIMRLLPGYARYGMKSSVQLGEVELLTLPEQLMRALRGKRLGMVFQEPMTALNPVLTIHEQLSEVFLQHERLNAATLEKRLVDALIEVDLDHPEIKLYQYPHQLSGGQKQRVVIAMALANHPDLLIADEPTTALDVTIQAQILDLIKRLQQQRNMSVLFITHDLGVVRAIANRVCVMYAGEIVQLAKVQDFFEEIRHPYIQQLLAATPNFKKRDHPLVTIKGLVPSLGEMPAGCRFHPRCAHAFDRCHVERPALIPWKQGSVRCHLYESGEPLPPLRILEEESRRLGQGPTYRCKEAPILLEAHDIHVNFEIKDRGFLPHHHLLKAVDGVSFTVKQGQTLAVVGESGSGKTTLSRAVLGLYPMTAGHIYFKQQDIHSFDHKQWHDYRKFVQIVFQDPFTSLDPRMTVGEILAEGMRAHGLMKTAIILKQRELLEQVYLPLKSLEKYPHEFSGGQRQRISIARALSTDPHILICDEPTSALDVSVQAQILNLFKELQANCGLSYLFITHNMNVVAYLADEVMVMKDGKVVESGLTEQILFHPNHGYTQDLLASVL
jgi:oligopeptide/dipeptide ABC transporter ATP-binding protein